ncbi:hypothetical protein M569_10294 [Genlisea aurea]|uniref:Uncharacterized protein n=1 Tax=Genlisea aurea TaxID=192259 RepID=S8CC76_9LAMI|nr:hypothetical protein M569_10294 [Genlisea aurea]
MDIDPDIRDWIVEYSLRKIKNARTLSSLLDSLPLSDNPTFKKLVVLKMLRSDVRRKSVSECSLEYFEQLAKIELDRGVETLSDAVKRAYCAVAVHCTLAVLKIGEGEHSDPVYRFFDAVRRIWRGKIGCAEAMKGKCGLGSEELWAWKAEIEASLLDDNVRKRILKNAEAIDAAEAIEAYLVEEEETMGPSFLELPALQIEDMQKTVGRSSCLNRPEKVISHGAHNESDVFDHMSGKGKENSTSDHCMDQVAEEEEDEKGNSNEIAAQKGEIADKPMENQVENSSPESSRQTRRRRRRKVHPRGAKLVNPDEKQAKPPSPGNDALPRSSEVEEVRKLLKSSTSDLHALVEDPLPEALRIAEEANNATTQNKKHRQPVEEENDAGTKNAFVCDRNGVVRSSGDAPKTSMMERNHTAESFEWDDSIDESPSATRLSRRLPSPTLIKVPPLNPYVDHKKRRLRRRWSRLEEETLTAGVKEIRRGNWKAILEAHRDVFDGRTEVDLKDKWRNLTGGY